MTTTTTTAYGVLFSISLVHFLNDTLQSVIPAILPLLRSELHLSLFQAGIILFAMNITASLFQPVIGIITDKTPLPFLLPVGLTSSGIGIAGLAIAPNFSAVILCSMLIGFGSATFHPEASRVAYMAAGPRRGLAQSIFQVGGNAGQAFAPLITVFLLLPYGQLGAGWFLIPAIIAVAVLCSIAMWYRRQLSFWQAKKTTGRRFSFRIRGPLPCCCW